MPDIFRVLLDRPVRREVAHVGNIQHRLIGPLFRVLIQLVDAILAVHIATIVRQNLVVVAKVNQRIQQVAVAPRFCRAEDAGTDLRQRLVELFILLVIFAWFITAAT